MNDFERKQWAAIVRCVGQIALVFFLMVPLFVLFLLSLLFG